MVRGAAGRFRCDAGKTQYRQIQFVNEGVDNPDRIFLSTKRFTATPETVSSGRFSYSRDP
jgi:hypothetical protein